MSDEHTGGTRSRRTFIQATALSGLAHLASKRWLARAAENGRVLAHVGSYTSAVDAGANGEGIYRFEMDPHTGAFTNRKLVARTPNPSWIVIHPSKKYLYAVNEMVNQQSGSVSAFAIEPVNGDLTLLNSVSSEGSGPAHLSLDTSGRFAFVANYAGGTIAVLPLLEGGRLGAAVDVHRDIGSVGAKAATDAPPGSFAISGHDAPHAHMIAADPANRFVLSVDLGQDRVYIYRFDPMRGQASDRETQDKHVKRQGEGSSAGGFLLP